MKKIFTGELTGGIIGLLNILVISIFLVATFSCSSNKKLPAQHAVNPLSKDSLLADRDGNQYRIKIYGSNNVWITANLNLNIPESYCYENLGTNCEKNGRLYTWTAAQKACSLLGEGWRLPTDNEWAQLADLYGGTYDSTSGSGKSAYRELLYAGKSQFNILLGGGRAPDGQYARIEAHGFYWTRTEIDSSTAWVYNFGKGSETLYHQDGIEKTRAISVRCIKNVR